ncbi:hypothetical protein CONCODRAFT_13924 [Conidiobolus coronatus NRRL 28638]|uniref:Uncharacterized protein n=1 Tax=Conidiobolus coronatus (strain ATCC 28846 / CBS 209.66 / NRRL 28638) TaxID=796925 RepID=A0A137NQ09_CONC2|nr:hypothetical protein CONCODRAFT_13924 [Conidiobolus coronatus NRRL 28638]|eukprot:KXN64790.1 hypothetical protein CONCODRAFT_13924 [Conidiobolus coronatus NRRL 28638]
MFVLRTNTTLKEYGESILLIIPLLSKFCLAFLYFTIILCLVVKVPLKSLILLYTIPKRFSIPLESNSFS